MHVIQEVDPNFQRTVSLSPRRLSGLSLHAECKPGLPPACRDFHQPAGLLQGPHAGHAWFGQGRLLQLCLVEAPCRRLSGVLPPALQLCGPASPHTSASRILQMADPADGGNFNDGLEKFCMCAGSMQCAESLQHCCLPLHILWQLLV